MRNRAKCKLCNDIIESFHSHDFVFCKCKEIFVDGGTNCYRSGASDYSNFMRVDDEGLEIEVRVVDSADAMKKEENDSVHAIPEKQSNQDIPQSTLPPTKEELLHMFDDFIKTYEDLPEQAMRLPINHYDHLSLMMLIRSIVKV